MNCLLIVGNDKEFNQELCKALRTDGFTAYFSQNIKDAHEQLILGGVSLVVLDSSLLDGSGFDLLREIKASTPKIPVILVTADETGLEVGADDLITKPFSLSVLQARINTQLCKKSQLQEEQKFHIDHFFFDFIHMQFLSGQKNIKLNKTEQKLLKLLVENRGSAVRRRDLIDRIWTDSDENVDENALSVAVNRLRNKLGAHEYIKTIYGIGYSWGRLTCSLPPEQ